VKQVSQAHTKPQGGGYGRAPPSLRPHPRGVLILIDAEFSP